MAFPALDPFFSPFPPFFDPPWIIRVISMHSDHSYHHRTNLVSQKDPVIIQGFRLDLDTNWIRRRDVEIFDGNQVLDRHNDN